LAPADPRTWLAIAGAISLATATFFTQRLLGQESAAAALHAATAKVFSVGRTARDCCICESACSSDYRHFCPLGTFRLPIILLREKTDLGRFLEGGESIRASITKLSQQIEKSREGKQDAAAERPGPANQELRNQTGP
jgi:hypothetical protein